MDTMKAYVRVSADNSNVELQEIEIPTINTNEMLVKVAAVGVGVHDRYFLPREASFPFPIGIEGSGTVVQTGDDVTDFHIDDRVIFSSSMQIKGGSWAEYVVVSPDATILMNDEMNFTTGAALPVAGKTALEGMNALGLSEGDTLFVAGASGAIGSFIIQLAASQGIQVAASASSKNHEYMTALGADKTVDYHDADWKEQVRDWMPGGVDAALAIQPGTGKDSMDVVKDTGKLITVSGDQLELTRDITGGQFQHQLNMQKHVGALAKDILQGKIKVEIEHIYPFKDALQALEKTESRHARGKLVVKMD